MRRILVSALVTSLRMTPVILTSLEFAARYVCVSSLEVWRSWNFGVHYEDTKSWSLDL